MKLANMLRRERSNLAVKATTTMNSTGVYKPPYGKGVVKIGGRGSSGTYSSGGNVAFYNPPLGGNIAYYNPDIPGNLAFYNSDIPGNFVGYNPPSPGNVASYNPSLPGNSGTNPPVSGISLYEYYSSPGGSFSSYSETGYFLVMPFSSYNAANQSYYSVDVGYASLPGNSYSNPPSPGNANYNSPSPGNPAYNPTEPGYAVYNADEPGYANYNPYTPGNANYNPYVPGLPSAPTNLFGVTFPGGAADSLAPVVAPAPSNIQYSTNGVTVTVSTGGYVSLTAT